MTEDDVIWGLRCPRNRSPAWHRAGWVRELRERISIDPVGWQPALSVLATVVEGETDSPPRAIAIGQQLARLSSVERACLGYVAAIGTLSCHMRPDTLMTAGLVTIGPKVALVVLLLRNDLAVDVDPVDRAVDLILTLTPDETHSLVKVAASSWLLLEGAAPELRGMAEHAAWKAARPVPR